LDNATMTALRLAAKRGVDVRIYTPGIPDKKMVYQLTCSYFEPLIRSGVKIYTFTPGFLHAKTWLVDGRIAVVGSINLDYRCCTCILNVPPCCMAVPRWPMWANL